MDPGLAPLLLGDTPLLKQTKQSPLRPYPLSADPLRARTACLPGPKQAAHRGATRTATARLMGQHPSRRLLIARNKRRGMFPMPRRRAIRSATRAPPWPGCRLVRREDRANVNGRPRVGRIVFHDHRAVFTLGHCSAPAIRRMMIGEHGVIHPELNGAVDGRVGT